MSSITDQDLILVTGASGFIATHLVKQLLEKGYRVRGTVRSLKNEKKVAPLRQLAINSKFELELVEADLTKDETWIDAVKGCTYVMHTASPVPDHIPKKDREDEVIVPARNGTLAVLKACVHDGCTVKRVVLTSSVAAIAGEKYVEGRTFTENDWPDRKELSPYSKSKVLAEKAAWDFVKERESKGLPCFELAVINPGLVMGPLLHDSDAASMSIIKWLMINKVPFVLDMYFPYCDVRDVAEAHIKAMIVPEAKNNRHIIASSKETSPILDWAKILHAEFTPKHYKITTSVCPNFLIRFGALFSSDLKVVTNMLGAKSNFDNSRFVNVLGIQPKDLKTTILDSAYGLIDKKMVPKKFQDSNA